MFDVLMKTVEYDIKMNTKYQNNCTADQRRTL